MMTTTTTTTTTSTHDHALQHVSVSVHIIQH